MRSAAATPSRSAHSSLSATCCRWWTQRPLAAKYKYIGVTGIDNPDLYQLLAYTIALDLPAGLLVYATGEAERVVHHVHHTNKELHVTTVDLAGAPDQILHDIARIA
jgi:5-methylcytosine-specific restriction enzyme subunit McrC